jgi:uncharacterized damage-inducible protein DinB
MDQESMVSILAGMKEYFDRSTRVLDEADSAFIPAEGMFTSAQVVAHVAQTVDWFFRGAFDGFDMDFERMDKEVRATTSLEAARKWLEQAYGEAISTVKAHSAAEGSSTLPAGPILGGRPRFEIIGALMDHTAHHRGALTVYSRLRGKVPAMPYMDA